MNAVWRQKATFNKAWAYRPPRPRALLPVCSSEAVGGRFSLKSLKVCPLDETFIWGWGWGQGQGVVPHSRVVLLKPKWRKPDVAFISHTLFGPHRAQNWEIKNPLSVSGSTYPQSLLGQKGWPVGRMERRCEPAPWSLAPWDTGGEFIMEFTMCAQRMEGVVAWANHSETALPLLAWRDEAAGEEAEGGVCGAGLRSRVAASVRTLWKWGRGTRNKRVSLSSLPPSTVTNSSWFAQDPLALAPKAPCPGSSSVPGTPRWLVTPSDLPLRLPHQLTPAGSRGQRAQGWSPQGQPWGTGHMGKGAEANAVILEITLPC